MTTPDLRRVAALLQRFDVECVLVGGMSAWVYGSTRLTSDIDTVARWSRVNLEKLGRALDSANAELRIHVDPGGDETKDRYIRPPGGYDFDTVRHVTSFRVRTRDGDLIDFLESIPMEPGASGRRANYDELLEHAQEAALGEDVAIRVVGQADLLQSKAAVGRDHDLEVVEELRASMTPQATEDRDQQ